MEAYNKVLSDESFVTICSRWEGQRGEARDWGHIGSPALQAILYRLNHQGKPKKAWLYLSSNTNSFPTMALLCKHKP